MPLSPSTLLDPFHTVARIGKPLYDALLAGVRTVDLMQADETRVEVQQKGKTRRAVVWAKNPALLAGDTMVYVFSPSQFYAPATR